MREGRKTEKERVADNNFAFPASPKPPFDDGDAIGHPRSVCVGAGDPGRNDGGLPSTPMPRNSFAGRGEARRSTDDPGGAERVRILPAIHAGARGLAAACRDLCGGEAISSRHITSVKWRRKETLPSRAASEHRGLFSPPPAPESCHAFSRPKSARSPFVGV